MPFLGLLTGIPIWAWALAGLGIWGGYGHYQASTLREQLTAERAAVQVEAARATALNEGETKRMKIEAEGNANALKAEIEVNRLRAAAESGNAERLRLAVKALRGGGTVPGAAAPATPGQAVERLGTVADECPARLRALVAVARDGLARARACERHSDSIAPPK